MSRQAAAQAALHGDTSLLMQGMHNLKEVESGGGGVPRRFIFCNLLFFSLVRAVQVTAYLLAGTKLKVPIGLALWLLRTLFDALCFRFVWLAKIALESEKCRH